MWLAYSLPVIEFGPIVLWAKLAIADLRVHQHIMPPHHILVGQRLELSKGQSL
jgi:hypothetical protein